MKDKALVIPNQVIGDVIINYYVEVYEVSKVMTNTVYARNNAIHSNGKLQKITSKKPYRSFYTENVEKLYDLYDVEMIK